VLYAAGERPVRPGRAGGLANLWRMQRPTIYCRLAQE